MNFDIYVIKNNFELLLEGLVGTLEISVISLILASLLGLILCFLLFQSGKISQSFVRGYISFFRTVPELSVIFWVYFCLPPIMDLRLSGLTCGILALSLIGGAYMAEIFRAGVEAVSKGQIEAAHSLGLGTIDNWRYIILPQAIEVMTPAFINYFTEILKNSTLLAAVGVSELAYQAYSIGADSYRYVEPLTMVAVFFFAIIFPLSVWSRRREKRLASQRSH